MEDQMEKINRHNSIPLYLQVISQLVKKINNNEWENGEKLPTEKELSDIFGVSLITIRKALQELNMQGMIYKIHGKGSYVSKNDNQIHDLKLNHIRSFSEEMATNKKDIGSILLNVKEISGTSEDIKIFKIKKNEKIIIVKRVRTVNGTPTHVSTHKIPSSILKNKENIDFSKSIYQTLESLNVKIEKGTEEITAVTPSNSEAEILGISSNQPVIKSTATITDGRNIIMITDSVINSKRIKIKVDLEL